MITTTHTTTPYHDATAEIHDQLERLRATGVKTLDDNELLNGYNIAAGWAQHIHDARKLAAAIAYEWQARHHQDLARLAAVFGRPPRTLAETQLAASLAARSALRPAPRPHRVTPRRLDPSPYPIVR